eukprot:992714-Amphidinium_carterae.1
MSASHCIFYTCKPIPSHHVSAPLSIILHEESFPEVLYDDSNIAVLREPDAVSAPSISAGDSKPQPDIVVTPTCVLYTLEYFGSWSELGNAQMIPREGLNRVQLMKR